MENVLLGIIIDVSSSMKKNWGNSIKIKQSKIEAVKNALNDEIKRINSINTGISDKSVSLFCLGIGFKLNLHLISVDTSDGNEKQTGVLRTSLIGIICDILALSELAPSKAKLETIKNEIHNYWDNSAKNLLEDIVIEENFHEKLAEYIELSLINSFRIKIHNFFDRQHYLIKNSIGSIVSFLGISMTDFLAKERAKKLSKEYSSEVQQKASNIFIQFSEKYKKTIEDKIKLFAQIEIDRILERNELGFDIKLILENFDKKQLIKLSEDIYTEIKKDISSEFTEIWQKHSFDFFVLKFKFLSSLDIFKVKELTENTVKNIGWARLKPFVENVVFNIFAETFDKQAKERIYNWINISAHREVTRPIANLSNILPNTSEADIYSDEFMFGGTPMLSAVNRAALRFNDSQFSTHRKILLIISDGEFENIQSIERTIKLMKQEGLIVVCGYINDKQIIPSFKKEIRDKTKESAQNLMSISSNFGDCPELIDLINKGEITAKADKKLCIQINQPNKLKILLGGLIK